MKLRFRGIGNETVTFKGEKALIDALKAEEFESFSGLSVGIVAGEEPTVGLGTDGGKIYGFALGCEADDIVTVMRCGMVANVKGDALEAGQTVVLDGKGGVKAGEGKAVVVAVGLADEGTVVDLK